MNGVLTGAATLVEEEDTVVLLGLEADEAPLVPDGARLSAMYPYTPVPPHKSSGYPEHCSLQSSPETVVPGT